MEYIHPNINGSISNKHVIVEGTKGDYDVSVLEGKLGDMGLVVMTHTVMTFPEAKRLAISLVYGFDLQGWEDVAHNPINK